MISHKRIVTVVDPCEHEEPHDFCSHPRRVLTEGQYVLIEKEDEPAFVDVWADIIHVQHGCPSPGRCSGTARTLLDALSDHTEGTL